MKVSRMKGHAMRSGALMLVALVGLVGCAIQRAPEVTPEALRTGIRAGEVLQPGDRVRLVTTEAGEREVVVVAVDADHIRATPVGGQQQGELSVPIDEVVSVHKVVLEKRAAKYLGPVAGLYVAAAVLGCLILGCW